MKTILVKMFVSLKLLLTLSICLGIANSLDWKQCPDEDAMSCNIKNPNMPLQWIDMETACVSAMREQIQKEVYACYVYLAMAAHFSSDSIERPGFAAMFFTAAAEEREHAMKLLSYLTMRGELATNISDLIRPAIVSKHVWQNGVAALEDALNLEITVTKSIRNIIRLCEMEPNDYHLVDYLTADFMDEQLRGQRDLAGKLSTLKKMLHQKGELGEFMFDKTLT